MVATSLRMAVGGAALAFVTTGAMAAQTWDMANEYNDSSLHAATQILFADTLEKETNGEIRINHHFGGAMGYSS